MPATAVLPPEPAPPEAIHNCPNCEHWLPDGTLVCPDCQFLTYGRHLSEIATSAQQLEVEDKWPEARDRWRSALQWLPEDNEQAAGVQRRIAQIDQRLEQQEQNRAKWTRRLGPFAPVLFFLLKAKSALFLLFKLKFFLSMFAFFGLYWALAGWKFALGFTAGVLFHESGHYLAVRRRGLKAELPMFIPGMGAYVRWYSQGVSLEDLAAISLAGPLFGLLISTIYLALSWTLHSTVFLLLANVTAWYNLFNLTPLLGLDGSQATFALSRMQRMLVAALSGLFFLLTAAGASANRNGTQWVFLFVAGGMAFRCFTEDAHEHASSRTMVMFCGLILLLGFMLYLTPVPGLR